MYATLLAKCGRGVCMRLVSMSGSEASALQSVTLEAAAATHEAPWQMSWTRLRTALLAGCDVSFASSSSRALHILQHPGR